MELSTEQRILLAHLNNLFDITAMEPLFYQSNVAGSEFETYNSKKLYFALDIAFGEANVAVNQPSLVRFYNEMNSYKFEASNDSCVYDNSSLLYKANNINIKNIYFSKLTTVQYAQMKFIGYRLTLA
ncbi:MAG: hypothetical protein U9O65_00775 [Thermotogota bacterium]|nr:hypothetical protein [Thermotogota bacterium]